MAKISAVILSSLSLLASSAFATDFMFHPTLGADVSWQHMRFESGYGKGHFAENYPATNFYGAARLHKYFGAELGYEHIYSMKKKQYYGPGSIVLGNTLAAGEERIYHSNAFFNGWNANLLGFLPLSKGKGTELMGLIGVSWLKGHYDTVPISNDTTIQNAPPLPVQYWQSETTPVLRLGVGVRQFLTCNFGVRAQAIWTDSSKLDNNFTTTESRTVQDGSNLVTITETKINTIRHKDSASLGIGFFYDFC